MTASNEVVTVSFKKKEGEVVCYLYMTAFQQRYSNSGFNFDVSAATDFKWLK